MSRFCLLSILLFSATLSMAQKWKELDDSVNSCYLRGDYKTGIDYSKKELADAEVEFGSSDSNYATSLDNLAALTEALGDYRGAEPMFKQALEIRKRVLGQWHSDYATSLNNLASLYEFIGNYSAAEPLFRQASVVYRKVLGEMNPNYAISLNNLATIYEDMGNYAAAEPLHKEALGIYKKVMGENDPEYAQSLHNLAVLYANMGNYAAAEPLFKQTVEIRKKIFGVEHPQYAQSLNNLADMYKDMGNYTAAEPLIKQAMEIRKKALGQDHPDYAVSMDNLASLYQSMDRLSEAEALYKQVIEKRKRILGEAHPDYAISLDGLAGLYAGEKKYKDAAPLYLAGLKIHKSQTEQQLSFLSEKEQEEYLVGIQQSFDIFQSFALLSYGTDPDISIQLNDLALFDKGLQLNSGISMRQKILGSADTALISLFNQWTDIKQTLAKLYSTPIGNRSSDVSVLENQANEMEKRLTRSSQAFKDRNEKQNIVTADVQAALGQDEAAVEFVSFKYYSAKGATDSILYAALVLRQGVSAPVLIPLFEEKQLSRLFTAGTSVNNLYAAQRGLNLMDSMTVYGRDLYKLVWGKIDPKLKGVKTVYYSPSGQLCRIAFAALPIDKTQLLSDKYNLVLLSSTAEVANKYRGSVSLNEHTTVALFGGIRYDAAVPEMQAAATPKSIYANAVALAYSGLPASTRGDISRENDWPYLRGTLDEVNKISAELKKMKIESSLYIGSSATEDILKSLQGKNAPTVLHIATHGFYFPEAKDKKAKPSNREEMARAAENPLLRTGLILAGGNNKWKNDTLQLPEGLNDGILTAYDVSNMDLSNTKLAVLSACQTGLGDIKGSEGVYGMQRAFKMAGVDYLIVSLWSVPDEATQEFMIGLYDRWAADGNLQKAFAETQQIMRTKYKDPYSWAAFFLIK